MGFPSYGRLGWTGRQRSGREPALREPPPVEAPILNRLAHMLRLKVRRSLEVSDGAGDLENPMIGPRRQREPRDRRAQQRVGAVRYATERADVARGHVRIGIDAQPVREPLPLRRTRPVHALPHGLARLAAAQVRSEEHTSELQSLAYLVC